MAMIGCLLAPRYCFSQRDTLRNNYYEQKEYPTQKQKPSFASRLMIGGNLGLAFGSVTYISVNPLVGYRVTNNFTAGIGINYQYWSEKYFDYIANNYYTVSSNIYGGSVFARYTVFRGLFLEGDFEANNLDAYTFDATNSSYTTARMWVPSLLLGGGYYSGGARGGFYISILYDVIQNIYSPYYGIPVIRAGVGFGL
jgi:hypothetical protein